MLSVHTFKSRRPLERQIFDFQRRLRTDYFAKLSDRGSKFSVLQVFRHLACLDRAFLDFTGTEV